MNRSFDVFNERRAALIFFNVVFVVPLDDLFFHLTKPVPVHGDIIIGHHRGNPSRNPRPGKRVGKPVKKPTEGLADPGTVIGES